MALHPGRENPVNRGGAWECAPQKLHPALAKKRSTGTQDRSDRPGDAPEQVGRTAPRRLGERQFLRQPVKDSLGLRGENLQHAEMQRWMTVDER